MQISEANSEDKAVEPRGSMGSGVRGYQAMEKQ